MRARDRNMTCNYKYSLFWKIRDVLPFTLKLPYAISTAKTEAQLEELAQLGLSKWGPLPWSLLNWISGAESVLGWYNVTSKNNPHLERKTLGLWGPWITSFENLFLSRTLNQFWVFLGNLHIPSVSLSLNYPECPSPNVMQPSTTCNSCPFCVNLLGKGSTWQKGKPSTGLLACTGFIQEEHTATDGTSVLSGIWQRRHLQ